MPAEVVVTEVAPGRHAVTVNGVKVDSVRAVTVSKVVGGMDVVTIEVLSQRTTVTPAPVTTGLEELEERDAELDARMASGGSVHP